MIIHEGHGHEWIDGLCDDNRCAELIEGDVLARRLAAIEAHKPTHPIIVLDGRCAICWREVYESGDYRGGRYRHEFDEAIDAPLLSR